MALDAPLTFTGTKLVRVPGTYAPQHDTALLVRSMLDGDLARGRSVLDICTGTGAVAVAAAAAGATSVTAVDLSRRAVLSARVNSMRRRIHLEVLRGDLFAPVAGRTFDLVVCNPPYVPAPTARLPRYSMGRCWDGGFDGRALVDRVCEGVASVLAPGGTFLLTHSAVTGAEQTALHLQSHGLDTRVVARSTVPFGPVMSSRAELLADRGLIDREQRCEELVVIAATSLEPPAPPSARHPEQLAG